MHASPTSSIIKKIKEGGREYQRPVYQVTQSYIYIKDILGYLVVS